MALLPQGAARVAGAYAAGFCLAASAQAPSRWHGPDPVQKGVPQEEPRKVPGGIHVELGQVLLKKFQNPAYAEALAARKVPPATHHMPEEHAVREVRARLAAARRAPAGAYVGTIPRAAAAPNLDGIAHPEEWRGALRIPLAPPQRQAWVMLLAHGGTLYLAAHAPGDRTAEGFDQFRFWYHLELSPFMENERVFVAGKGWMVSLRGVRLPRGGAAPDERAEPKSLQQHTDWNIFARLRGASNVSGHRQFEMALELAEAGLFPGAPFPAFFEVEGDPESHPDGKFKARVIEGAAGSAREPLWLQIAR